MPRSTLATRRAQGFDKNLELRNYTAAALAATASGTAIAIPEAVTAHNYKCVVHSAAYTGFVAGTAQWVISVEVSTQIATGFVAVGSVVLDGTLREWDIPLSGEWVEQRVPGARFVRVTATKVGAAGDVTYGAYLAI